jgi:biotin operon repressor
MPPPDPSNPQAKLILQQMAATMFNTLAPALENMFRQAVNAGQQSVSPAGRPVEVNRREGKQVTTTPQLLAELNDNILELIEELKETNDLADEQLKATPRRRRG